MNKYETYLNKKGNQSATITTTMYRLRNWLDRRLSIREVNQEYLDQEYQQRCNEVAVETHRAELREIKTFFRWVIRQGYLPESPAENVEPVGRRRRGKPQLRRNEARAFYRAALSLANVYDPGALACLAVITMGLRSSEILRRKVRDVDADKDGVLLWIDAGKTQASVRRYEVPEPVASLLVEATQGKQPADWVFPQPDGPHGPRRREWLINACRRICGLAGVPKITPHGLRGTWATLTTEAGISSEVVAREMGHASDEVTKGHYIESGAIERARTRKMLKVIEGGK